MVASTLKSFCSSPVTHTITLGGGGYAIGALALSPLCGITVATSLIATYGYLYYVWVLKPLLKELSSLKEENETHKAHIQKLHDEILNLSLKLDAISNHKKTTANYLASVVNNLALVFLGFILGGVLSEALMPLEWRLGFSASFALDKFLF